MANHTNRTVLRPDPDCCAETRRFHRPRRPVCGFEFSCRGLMQTCRGECRDIRRIRLRAAHRQFKRLVHLLPAQVGYLTCAGIQLASNKAAVQGNTFWLFAIWQSPASTAPAQLDLPSSSGRRYRALRTTPELPGAATCPNASWAASSQNKLELAGRWRLAPCRR